MRKLFTVAMALFLVFGNVLSLTQPVLTLVTSTNNASFLTALIQDPLIAEASEVNESLLYTLLIPEKPQPEMLAEDVSNPDTLIVLDTTDITTMQEAIALVASKGGHVFHVFPPHILIGMVPPPADAALLGYASIKEIHRTTLDPAHFSDLGTSAQMGVEAWNTIVDPSNHKSSSQPLSYLSQPPDGPSFMLPNSLDTSQYLIGKVAVGIILPESAGDTENWTTAEREQVTSEIISGTQWWAAREPRANLTFFYDVHFGVTTSYEPISMTGHQPPEGEEHLWISQVMTAMGYPAEHNDSLRDYLYQAIDYVKAIRTNFQSDWAFAIFVVDSSNDADGLFSNNVAAYAKIGGPFIVMTYDNSKESYGIENMDMVTAHEMGHIFWAQDQYIDDARRIGYSDSDCSKRSGFLNVPNENQDLKEGSCASDEYSIMRSEILAYGNAQIDYYARGQVGWWDENGNGVLDPLDNKPPCVLNAALISESITPSNVLLPGQSFTKVWRIKNTGTCPWGGTSTVRLNFMNGDQMGATQYVAAPTTNPGEIAVFSASMVAPAEQGTYTGEWQMCKGFCTNDYGLFFGPKVYANITVPSGPPPSAPPPGTDPDIELQCLNCPTVVTPGQQFRPTIRATLHTGALLESRGDMLLHTNDPYYTNFPHIGVVGNYYAGSTYNFQFYAEHPLVAPTAEGTYESKWRVWRNGNWAGDELTIRFDVRNGGGTRPEPPALVRPSNWYKSMDGSTPELCASAPAGLLYDFQLYQGQADRESGWTSSNCWTPATLPSGKYKWHVKVKDPATNIESDWSADWYFDVVSQDPVTHGPLFQPGSPSSADEVRTWFCIEDTGGVELYANTATDCSASGEWQWIAHPVPPLCSLDEEDPSKWPEWHTRAQPDGSHLIRTIAWHGNAGQSNYREEVTENICYTLGRRRPADVQRINPPQDGWMNSPTIAFRWNPEESSRINEFRWYVSPNPDPQISPIVSQTIMVTTTRVTTYTFAQAYPSLYWQILACNELGCSDRLVGHFGIDVISPTSVVNTLPITLYDTLQNITWTCTDNASGCQRYTVQVRDDALGEWQDWRSGVTEVSGLFRGLPGHRYCFRVRAVDNAGNLENWPANPDGDTCTLIDLDNRPPETWWNSAYGFKRTLTVLNWDSHVLGTGFPVRVHFDGTTTPSAAEIYNASTAAIKGDDVRVVYQNITEVSRYLQTFTPEAVDIWFALKADIAPNPDSTTAYQLYYNNPAASNPPAQPGDIFLPPNDSGVVAAWYFQEWGGNTASDSSGNGHTATRVNGGAWMTTLRGPAIDVIKDSQQYLTVNNPSSLNLSQFTFEAWFFRDHSDVGALLGKWREGDNDSSYLFGVWQRKMMLRLRSPAGDFFETPENQQTAIGFDDNRWYHIAATYDGSQVRFYVNGELKYTQGWTNGVRVSSKDVYLAVHQTPSGLDGNFDGLLAGMRISNYARTSFPYGAMADVVNQPEASAGVETQYESPTLQPDLAVLSLTTYPAPVNQGGGRIIQAVVKNQGTRATRNGAWTMLYADHLPTVGDLNGVSFWLGTPIQVGAVATLTTYLSQTTALGRSSATQALAEVTHTLYTQADATGVVKDSNRANNISSGTAICLANPDAYEPNNTITAAVALAIGAAVPLNFHGTEDQDWFKFTAQGSVTYTLQTTNLGAAADTYLYLYGTDGVTLLAANDDYGGSLASRLDWRAPANGNYYLLVKHWNPNVGGCGTTYTLSVAPVTAVASLTLDGQNEGMIAIAYTAAATISPIAATMPIVYSWQATGQSSMTNTGGLSDTVVFTWNTPGAKVITVTATNAGGSVGRTHNVTIYAPVLADFTANLTDGTAPFTVNFTDSSSGQISYWNWAFGDGGTSTLQHPAHTFKKPGNYTVSLTVHLPGAAAALPGGTNTRIKTNYIVVRAQPGGTTVYLPMVLRNFDPETVYADFAASPITGRSPLAVQFTDQSSGPVFGWAWNFGDGGTSWEQNPAHTYANEGTYSVSLTVYGPRGNDTHIKTGYIVVVAQTPNLKVNDDTSTANQTEPRIAVDTAGNIYAIWVDERNGNQDIYFSRKTPSGAWVVNGRVNDDVGTAYQDFPDLTVDSSNNTYAVWDDGREDGYGDVFFSYRPAGGNWTTNVRVNDFTWAGQNHASLAVDVAGNAYAVWNDWRDYNDDIYFSARPVNGEWTVSLKASDDPGTADQSRPRIAVDTSGNAYAVWHDMRNGNKDIYFSYRPINGTWGTNVKVNDDVGLADQQQPSIAVDSAGNAYVVWEDMRNGNQDIYFSQRSSSGTWSINRRLNDDTETATQAMPQIAVDSAGNAHVVWQDNRLGDGHIFYTYRLDGGSWRANAQIDSAGTQHEWPAIAVDKKGNVYVIWSDNRNGDLDIYYTAFANTALATTGRSR